MIRYLAYWASIAFILFCAFVGAYSIGVLIAGGSI